MSEAKQGRALFGTGLGNQAVGLAFVSVILRRYRSNLLSSDGMISSAMLNPNPQPQEKQATDETNLTDAEKEQLADAAKQEEYRKAHLAQLRRLQCPGCGETDLF